MPESRSEGMHPAWWTLILVVATVGIIALTSALFSGAFASHVPVTLVSDRAGPVMERGGKVKMRGVQVGWVSRITAGTTNQVRLKLEIYPGEIRYIPANVRARIRATTLFSGKYVELVYPSDASSKRLTAGTVLEAESVGTEVNTMFANLVGVLNHIDPAKLHAVLSALAEGLRGHGAIIGRGITDANQVLPGINPRSETIRADMQAVKGVSDTYSAAAQNILTVLEAPSVTSATTTDESPALDSLLTGVVGLSRSGINLIGPNKDSLVKAVNLLDPTTSLLMKYNPGLTCMLVGAKTALDTGYRDATGGANGYSLILDSTPLFGADQYRYPQNLPIVGAKGGPGGKPGCGSLPDVAANWPLRQLMTNTGWAPDWISGPIRESRSRLRGLPPSHPGSARAAEHPLPGGPAPGPIPYPGPPPYGASQYAPDGTPLYPGLPPVPPPGAPREPGPPPPGSEPFVVPAPAQLQPTPAPPLPEAVTPSP